MARAFRTEVIRSISGSLGRFIAIAAIVALGTGFYAGLRMTQPDMQLAADQFYDGTQLMDVRVVSTLGLTSQDIDALRQVEGVEAVMPAYETDAMSIINGEQYAMRVHSLSAAAATSDTDDGVHALSDDDSYLNRLILVEGSWPAADNECVISADKVMSSPTALGDTVTLAEVQQDGALTQLDYTVVGYVHASYYVSSTSMGATTIGSGSIQQFMYVPPGAFSSDIPYTEAYLTVAGASAEKAGSAAYEQRVQQAIDRLDALAPEREQARADQLKAEALQTLDDKRADFEQQKADANAQLDQAREQLDQAAATLASSEQQLQAAQAEYDSAAAQLEQQRQQAQSQLDQTQAQLDQGAEALEQARPQLEQGAAQLSAGWAQYNQAKAALDALDPATPGYEQMKAQLEQQGAQLEAQQAAFDQQRESFSQQEGQLRLGQAALEEARQQAQQQLASAQAQLDAAAAQIASGRQQLAQGWQDYDQGLATYEENRAEADGRFEDAQAQIDQAQRKIDDIGAAEWLVMSRQQNYGVVSYESDAGRIDSIAQVFPFIFFLVAALVALTTMTRMVEEERGLIGTFKALGYGRGHIVSKYLTYAALASITGSVAGIAILSQVLPLVISKAYAIIYFVPDGPRPIDMPLALLAAGMGVGVTLVATLAAALATVRERPSLLMLPRAPKAGKRILLERIGSLWRHLSFSWKVTFRNLFRYKKRFIMTVIGIVGCTALLLTGLGLQNSINDIIDKQFGRIVNYNAVITLQDSPTAQQRQEVASLVDDQGLVTSYATAKAQSMRALGAADDDYGVTMVVPQDNDDVARFITFRNRTSGQALSLDAQGVIVSEKLATALGVSPGDDIVLAKQDSMGNATATAYRFPVAAIMENYIYNYVFVDKGLYQQVVGERPTFDTLYATVPADEAVRSRLNDAARALGGVKTLAYNDETIDAYRTMLKSVNMIVVVLVVAAAALAFIVLYNLTNINITERQREIATLKVLGFTPREVNSYIFREIMLLAAIGCLFGLAFGIYLEGFVVVTAEVDQVMFGRDIHVASFAAAFALTMLFAVVVTFAMRHKLRAIDMVESLKSNE